jgi:hypothetical protein
MSDIKSQLMQFINAKWPVASNAVDIFVAGFRATISCTNSNRGLEVAYANGIWYNCFGARTNLVKEIIESGFGETMDIIENNYRVLKIREQTVPNEELSRYYDIYYDKMQKNTGQTLVTCKRDGVYFGCFSQNTNGQKCASYDALKKLAIAAN